MSIELKNVKHRGLLAAEKGQDSFLAHIFDNIGDTNKFYVEFGARDGWAGCNTAYFRENLGWAGLLLEGCIDADVPNLNLRKRFLTAENIIETFDEFNVPLDLDLLCIDVDGMDYWILKKILTKYTPRVIMVETNVRFGPYESMALKYYPNWVWDGGKWYGASPYAYKKMVNEYNYTPIYMFEDEMFIVNNSLLDQEDINRDWMVVYPRSNAGLYGGHRGPGNVRVDELDKENWIEV